MESSSGEETPAAEEEDEADGGASPCGPASGALRRQAKAAAKREGEAVLVEAAWTSILEFREAKLKEEEEGQNERSRQPTTAR